MLLSLMTFCVFVTKGQMSFWNDLADTTNSWKSASDDKENSKLITLRSLLNLLHSVLLADFLDQIKEGPKNYFIDFEKEPNINSLDRGDKIDKLIMANLFR